MVFSGLVMAWRLATWPTRRSPDLVNATTEGVVRPPSSLSMTLGSPPSITATTELVVPRSIPIILPMTDPPTYKHMKTQDKYYARDSIMRVECVTVKVLDEDGRFQVAGNRGRPEASPQSELHAGGNATVCAASFAHIVRFDLKG